MRREILAWLLATLAGAVALFSLSLAIQPFLPGYQEQMNWFEQQTGTPPIPEGFDPRALGLAAWFTFSVTITFPLGSIALILWWRASKERRRERERSRESAAWSTTALLAWFDRLPTAATGGPEALRTCVDEAVQEIGVHLIEPHRRCFDRAIELQGLAPPELTDNAAAPQPTSTLPSAVVRILLVLAAGMAAMAGLTGVSVSSFDMMPHIGLPLGPAAVFVGVSSWAILSLTTATFAFGLRFLHRRGRHLEAISKAELMGQLPRLCEGLFLALERSGGPTFLEANERHRRAMSAVVQSIAESTGGDARRSLLARLEAAGYLWGPGALDLGGASLGLMEESVAGPSRPARLQPEDASTGSWGTVLRSPAQEAAQENRARKLELRSLMAFHMAIFFLAGVSHVATLAMGTEAGWIPAPTEEWEKTLFSMRGYLLSAAPFVLAAALCLGLAWTSWKSSTIKEVST